MSVNSHTDSADQTERFARFAGVGAALYPGPNPTLDQVNMLLPGGPTVDRCRVELVVREGGRAAAIINPRLTDSRGVPMGLIGFFECVDDSAVARSVLDEASDWLTAQGCATIRGPINFTTWHNYRFVVRGHDVGWIPGEPFHHAYYPALWEAAGFARAERYSSNWMTDPASIVERFAPRATACLEAGCTIRNVRPDAQEMARALSISRRAFAGARMYSEADPAELGLLYHPDKIAPIASFSYMAFSPDGSPAGFILTFPIAVAGRSRCIVIKTVAVDPAYRSLGCYKLLIHRAMSDQLAAGFEHFVAALMHMDGSPKQMGWATPETCIKEYAVYERQSPG